MKTEPVFGLRADDCNVVSDDDSNVDSDDDDVGGSGSRGGRRVRGGRGVRGGCGVCGGRGGGSNNVIDNFREIEKETDIPPPPRPFQQQPGP